MNRPSKKDIKAAIDKLKSAPEGSSESGPPPAPTVNLSDKKPNKNRIRKQGV